MFQKVVTKYWLSFHIILLLCVSWYGLFCEKNTLGFVHLWLAVFALQMLFLTPALKRGETLFEGRERLLGSFFKDPMCYIGVALIVFSSIQWLNSGCQLVYQVSIKIWRYAAPPNTWLPYSIDADISWHHLIITVVFVVLVLCMRLGLGRSSRKMCLLLLSALSGGVAVVTFGLALAGNTFYQGCALTPSALSAGVFFSFWMFVGIGVFLDFIGSSRDWPWLAYFASVLSNLVGVLYFGSDLVILLSAALLLVIALYSLVYVRAAGLRGIASFRFIFLFILGFSICVGVVGWVPAQQPLLDKVMKIPDLSTRFETLMESKAFRNQLAVKIWEDSPWTGVGAGGYSKYMRSYLRDHEWVRVRPDENVVLNDYVQILCENGILGSILLGAAILVLVSPLFYYIRMLWLSTAHAQGSFLADLTPIVVTGCLAILMCIVMGWFSSPFQTSSLLLSWFSVLALLPGTITYDKKKAR